MAEPRPHRTPEAPSDRRALGGPGVLLVVVYGVLALAATGRSVLQISEYFDRAPLAYLLSAFAAVVYVLATWCLARGGAWVRVGIAACAVELAGVLVVGLASYLVPSAFPDKTVWSHLGQGYGFVPLVLPVLGLLWFRRVERGARAVPAASAASTAPSSGGDGTAATPE